SLMSPRSSIRSRRRPASITALWRDPRTPMDGSLSGCRSRTESRGSVMSTAVGQGLTGRARIFRGIDDNKRVAGEWRRRPAGQQQGRETNFLLRGLLVIAVEHAVRVEETIHLCRYAHTTVRRGTTNPPFESGGISR